MTDDVEVVSVNVVEQNRDTTLVLRFSPDTAKLIRDVLGPTSREDTRTFVQLGVSERGLDEKEATYVFDRMLFDIYDELATAYPEESDD